MKRKYFGTDGVRGRVGQYPITPDFAVRLGLAAGKVLGKKHGGKVIIGKDTRLSGYMLEAALESGFSAGGMSPVMLGPMPTPAVAYLTRAFRADLGVVISASHNPYYDNGIKFFSAHGTKLPDEVELEIESVLDAKDIPLAASSDFGRAFRQDDAPGRYIEYCKSTFASHFSLEGMKIVLDCANGATYHIAPLVFRELGATVITIGDKPNGININDGVGSTHPEALVAKVLSEKADLGIAFDDSCKFTDAPAASYPGKLVQLLFHRYKFFEGDPTKGMILMPCELIFLNGHHLKECIYQYIELWKEDMGADYEGFKEWFTNHCYVCATLVDRIVPGFPRDTIKEIQQKVCYKDNLVVKAESFHLWVIEKAENMTVEQMQEEFPAHKAGLQIGRAHV